MKWLETTDIETGFVSEYIYSDRNWKGVPAGMDSAGRVYIWCPKELPTDGSYIIRSGRKWRVIEK